MLFKAVPKYSVVERSLLLLFLIYAGLFLSCSIPDAVPADLDIGEGLPAKMTEIIDLREYIIPSKENIGSLYEYRLLDTLVSYQSHELLDSADSFITAIKSFYDKSGNIKTRMILEFDSNKVRVQKTINFFDSASFEEDWNDGNIIYDLDRESSFEYFFKEPNQDTVFKVVTFFNHHFSQLYFPFNDSINQALVFEGKVVRCWGQKSQITKLKHFFVKGVGLVKIEYDNDGSVRSKELHHVEQMHHSSRIELEDGRSPNNYR
jgi:hypothetical protein